MLSIISTTPGHMGLTGPGHDAVTVSVLSIIGPAALVICTQCLGAFYNSCTPGHSEITGSQP